MSLVNAHWFDLVAIVVLVVGFKLGPRKEALPQLLSASHWALTLLICSFLYKVPANWLAKTFSMQPDVMALTIFPIEFLFVYFLLNFTRRRLAKQNAEKEPFGRWEYQMTKVAGALRFLVFMLVVMAWISGRHVTEKDIRDHKAFCEENFGSITFPVLRTIHDDMFNGSYTGKFAKKYLDGLMMTAIPRIDYPEKPVKVVASRKSTVKLRELTDNFERESDDQQGTETDGKSRTAREREANPQTSGSGNSAANGPSSGNIIYKEITLRGISGSGDRLFALINDQTFQAGELSSIRFEERKISVQCVQIFERSVVIRLEDKVEPIELKLGVAINLKGEPIVKNE